MIKQTRTYIPPAGHNNVVAITDWAETLSPEDKVEFFRGHRFQQAREKTFKTLNKLVINDQGYGKYIYEWDSQESADQCGADATFDKFHARYLAETGIKLDIQTETL